MNPMGEFRSLAVAVVTAVVGCSAAYAAERQWDFAPQSIVGSNRSSIAALPTVTPVDVKVAQSLGLPMSAAALSGSAAPLAAPAPAGVDASVKQADYEYLAKTMAGPACQPTADPCCEARLERTWYTRVDWFHWNERVDGEDFVNENGPLITLGYVRRRDFERFRGELFGGQVGYLADMDLPWGVETLSSHTDYLGVRGEYELVAEPQNFRRMNVFVGLGTRIWIRNGPDAVTEEGTPVFGYYETWWTIYPYLGIETRSRPIEDWAFYGSGRVGVTAVTFERASVNDVVLFPKPNITAQAEGGIRGRRMFVGSFFEIMAWGESEPAGGWLQPASTMIEVGLKTGWWF